MLLGLSKKKKNNNNNPRTPRPPIQIENPSTQLNYSYLFYCLIDLNFEVQFIRKWCNTLAATRCKGNNRALHIEAPHKVQLWACYHLKIIRKKDAVVWILTFPEISNICTYLSMPTDRQPNLIVEEYIKKSQNAKWQFHSVLLMALFDKSSGRDWQVNGGSLHFHSYCLFQTLY